MSKPFLKAMATLEQRFTSGNSVPVESTRITAEEFEAISDELLRLTMFEMRTLLQSTTLQVRIWD